MVQEKAQIMVVGKLENFQVSLLKFNKWEEVLQLERQINYFTFFLLFLQIYFVKKNYLKRMYKILSQHSIIITKISSCKICGLTRNDQISFIFLNLYLQIS